MPLPPFLSAWLAAQPAANWADLQGAHVDVRFPLREPLINQAIQELVLPRVPALRRLSLAVRGQNQIDVTAASSGLSFLPALTVPLEIDPVVAFTPTPVVRMRVRRQGIAGALVPLLGLIAGALPRGVRLEDGGILLLDLVMLAGERDTLRVLPMLRAATIDTAPGVVWVSAQLRVEPVHA